MIDINKNYNESNLETMAKMPDCFVDLTVTSPPYDDLRTYNGFVFDWKAIIKELYRVTKHGGVVVWIVGDATIKGSETGTSFKQALHAIDCGFNLHDTMIWDKVSPPPNDTRQNRYVNALEYMFILSKGKPNICNYIREESINKGKVRSGKQRKPNGERRMDFANKSSVNDYKVITNIWRVHKHKGSKHPAPFPEQIANDHIISWSSENDLIYDPFMGSGTTAKMSILNNRNWIGSEISNEYCNIIEERIEKAWEEKRKEKDFNVVTSFGDGM